MNDDLGDWIDATRNKPIWSDPVNSCESVGLLSSLSLLLSLFEDRVAAVGEGSRGGCRQRCNHASSGYDYGVQEPGHGRGSL
jgi:hypothetical protein